MRIELGGRTKGDRGLRCDRGGGEGTEPPSSPFLSLLPFLLLVVVVVVVVVLVLQCCYVRLQLWQVNLGEREFVLFLFLFFPPFVLAGRRVNRIVRDIIFFFSLEKGRLQARVPIHQKVSHHIMKI